MTKSQIALRRRRAFAWGWMPDRYLRRATRHIRFHDLRHSCATFLIAQGVHPRVVNVRVFGSVARGEARPTSDIDLLITIDETRSLLDYIALMQDLEDLLGRRIDLVIEPDLHPAIRERVLAEALPV